MVSRDQRAHKRVAKELPLKVKIPIQSADVVIQTQNLSCSGALCTCDRFIAPMTKVNITMLLPPHGKRAAKKVTCTGVVVRIKEDKESGLFHIGLFFNDIKEKERHKIEDFIEDYSD